MISVDTCYQKNVAVRAWMEVTYNTTNAHLMILNILPGRAELHRKCASPFQKIFFPAQDRLLSDIMKIQANLFQSPVLESGLSTGNHMLQLCKASQGKYKAKEGHCFM